MRRALIGAAALVVSASMAACAVAGSPAVTVTPDVTRAPAARGTPVAPTPAVPTASSPGPTMIPTPTPTALPTATPSPELSPSSWPSIEPTFPPIGAPFEQVTAFQAVAWSGVRFVLAAEVDDPATDAARVGFWALDGDTWIVAGATAGTVSEFAFEPSGRGVAVGSDEAGAAAWISDGGVQWSRVSSAAFGPIATGERIKLRRVAHSGAGYVAIGEAGPYAVILASPDGSTWTRVQSGPTGTRTTLEEIAASDDGFLLVAKQRKPYEAQIWSSDDGRAWTKVTDLPSGWEPFAMSSFPSTIGHVPAGWFLVRGPGASANHVWRSTDGSSWLPAADAPGTGLSGFDRGLIYGPTGITVPGGEMGCPSTLWTSTDGSEWTCVPSTERLPEWSGLTLAASSDEVVAVGVTPGDPTWRASLVP
jgi:hypothetical protein